MLNTLFTALPYFILPCAISFASVPLVKWIGLQLGIYAVENSRTVHQGKMVRLGGVAIYLAFMISMTFLVRRADYMINGLMIGGTIVFLGGLIDDMLDLPPIVKICFQAAGALVAIFIGKVSLTQIFLPLGIEIQTGTISMLISFVWIVGVTNSINLIDGLDGLADGISFIVLCTIGGIAYLMGQQAVAIMCLILAGATIGLLPYNFHPASIFMGDCGALFLGFMIACFSLMGFKTTAFITLFVPIIILFVPIFDTLIAIVRRRLKGQNISEADRSHLHHIIMYRLNIGHRNTVLILYFVTLLFGMCAVLNYVNERWGLVLLFFLCLIFEIFIEITEMINPKYHPIIGLCRRLTGYPKKKIPFIEETKISETDDEEKLECIGSDFDDEKNK